MAGLLLGWQGASVFALLSLLSGWILAYAETMGKITPTLDTPLHFARDTTGIFLLETVLIYLMIASLRSALNNSRSITRELSDANQELNKLRVELEQRVIDRTSELEKRASQLETVSEVARTIASMQDLDRLLPAITKLISQQFGYYHVGIFLLDERNGRAVLRASNSAGGLHLIRQHHSLPLEENSLVGYTISHGEPRIVKDLSLSHIPLDQSILPETRSESAIPLRLAGKVIGSIDIQSSQIDAFTQEDIDVLTTLADQAAIAIENARLFSETKNALAESQALFEKYTQQEWRSFSQQTKHTGFVFDGKQVIPLENKVNRGPVQAVFQTGGLSLEKASATIAVPIKLRGQTIGVLDVRSKSGNRDWNQDEITLLEAAAERAGLALENARLIENAQRRAARERAIGDIATKIGAVSNLESILQTAVEELGRKIGGATEVTLEFSSNDERNQG
jgi:GAF domain-containing protein